jgi:hypothetical protein
MKTHIIQLEQYDDIISARDKMSWAKGERILMVWPERGRVLHRRLDLVLLQRQSAAQGAQLALVTQDPDVRYFALRLGIPVFKSLRKAQRAVWRLPRRFRGATKPSGFRRPADDALVDAGQQPDGEQAVDDLPPDEAQPVEMGRRLPPRPERSGEAIKPAARLGFFTLGVMALLAIAMTLLPSATVTLTPQSGVQEVTLDVQAGAQINEVDLSGAAPAHWLEVTVEGRDTMPASGTLLAPDRPAGGEVLFTNLTDQPVFISEGTVVLGQGEQAQRFSVDRGGELAAGPGETILLPVVALSPGSQGNLPAGSLIAIEGMLGTQVSVSNPQATRSGSDRREPMPSPADRRLLAERLHKSLEETAVQELTDGLAPGDLLLVSTLQLAETLEENFEPGEDQPADQLRLNMRLKYRAQAVRAEDLNALAQAVFDANLPAGFIPVDGSLQVENLDTPELVAEGADPAAGQTLKWKLHAYRYILAQTPPAQVIRLVLGFDPEEARQRLQDELALEEPPQIRLAPGWWPRMPILPFRVAVQVQVPGAADQPPASADQPADREGGS